LEQGALIFGVGVSETFLSMSLQKLKFVAKRSKCAWLASCTKFVQLAKSQHSCAPPKKSVINWTWLRLSI
jgi:hypothetical protein